MLCHHAWGTRYISRCSQCIHYVLPCMPRLVYSQRGGNLPGFYIPWIVGTPARTNGTPASLHASSPSSQTVCTRVFASVLLLPIFVFRFSKLLASSLPWQPETPANDPGLNAPPPFLPDCNPHWCNARPIWDVRDEESSHSNLAAVAVCGGARGGERRRCR